MLCTKSPCGSWYGYGTTCTVTYSISDPKLVSSGSLTQEFAAGQPFAIVTPVLKARPGYYLIGYSRTGDASSTVYKRGDTAMFVGNVTLYPVWKKICARWNGSIMLTSLRSAVAAS